MKLVALGWDLPPGYTHPIRQILATVFKSPRAPSNDIERALEELDRPGGQKAA